MGRNVDFDFSQFKAFIQKLKQAAGSDFKKTLPLFLEAAGFEFIRVLTDEIERRKVMDTRLLLDSFTKGDTENVWVLNDGDLSLEVGTNVKYAAYVNDGHWTNPKGVETRFIPGDVVLGTDGKIIKFTYNKDAKTGMVLKQKWVKGTHYWEAALKYFEPILEKSLEVKLQEWINEYFKELL